MVTNREEYESEISRLSSLIRKAQEDYNYQKQMRDKSRSSCAGIKGWRGKGLSECDAWKMDSAKLWQKEEPSYQARIQNAKQALWDYQKAIAKAEQDAQVKAVREAIAEQVRLEQERIQQSQQNQMIMEQAPPPEPEPEAAASSQILESSFELPFHYNYLIPIMAIGGYLVLRY
jgi:hypothetical protein